PGIGSWLALAIQQKDIKAIVLAVVTMAVTILAYDQLIFRPVVAWADKFRFEQTAAQEPPRSWVYDLVRRARLIRRLVAALQWAAQRLFVLSLPVHRSSKPLVTPVGSRLGDLVWRVVVVLATAYALWQLARYVRLTLGPRDVIDAFELGALTLARVVV